MLSSKFTNWKWFLKGILYLIIYAIIALYGYSVVSEIYLTSPRTLFTPIDYMIPFIGWFAIFYVFIYFPFYLFGIGYFTFIKREKADRFMLSMFLIYAISFLIYILFPVKMIRPDPESLPTDFLSQVMRKYYEHDPPLNCFPSLHAATSTFVAYHFYKEDKKFGYLAWIIAFLVMTATLFVRQHVIIDEIAGFLLAIVSAKVGEKYIPLTEADEKIPIWRWIFTIVLWILVTAFLISGYIP